MHKEIIINSSPNEVRVALLEDHEVVEFSMERADSKRAVGNVYKGVVTAVRPGLQAAFVEIGMEKAGFLHVSDLVHDSPDDEEDQGGRGGRRRRGRREGLRPIESMLKEGDEILVQVTKEVIGTKGPRLTADISLPGRYMVLMPKGDHVGVSRKIEDRKERYRLRDILSSLKPDDEAGAFIIRTAAVGMDAKILARDMEYLRDLYKQIQQKAHTVKAPALVHEDVGLIVSLVRDILKDDINRVLVDSREDYDQLVTYVKNFSPELRDRIELYTGDLPIFDKFGIEAELKKSLDRKVWMKRGGFLVIEQTEALVAIDVNTGRYTGKKNQAETIFKTNMLAAKEIARQLRLRDVGGIIVLDFIDMDNEEDKRKVLNELRTHLKRDRARTKTFAVSDLGLIEMSRQRIQESLKDRLSDDCPYCNGSGQIFSVATLANKIERLLLKLGATAREKAVQVRANPTLALALMTERANELQQLSRSTGIQIDVVDDARLHREEFQIVSVARRKDLVAEIEKASAGAGARDEAPADDRRRRSASEGRSGEGDRSRRRRGGRSEREDSDERSGRRSRSQSADRNASPEVVGSRDRVESVEVADEERRGRRRRRRGGRSSSSERAPESAPRSPEPGREPSGDRRSWRGGNERVESSPAGGSPSAEEIRTEGTGENSGAVLEPRRDDQGEEKPRRRRRRGRRGGRGRRKAGAEGEASPNQEERTLEHGSDRREEPAAPAPPRSIEAPVVEDAVVDEQGASSESVRERETVVDTRTEEDERGRRRRRSRRPADREPRRRETASSSVEPSPSEEDDADRPRTPGPSPVARPADYVRPILEEEAAEIADSAAAERALEPTPPQPVQATGSDATIGSQEDDAAAEEGALRTRRRRRRRRRAAGSR